MSFSVEVKEELSKLSNLANKEVVKYEFLGYMASSNVSMSKNHMLKFSTENEYNVNRFAKLLNNLGYNNYKIKIVGKTFYITTKAPNLEEIQYKASNIILNKEQIKSKILDNDIFQKAFVRGAFLGSGYINNPKSNYHLELVFSDTENADMVLNILESYDIVLKQLKKKNGYGLYAKDGEQISKFLAFVEASHSVLKFEEIRVYRDIRNNVNRKVNCETANLNKTVNSALKQINAIEFLKKNGKFKELSPALQEIAEIRIAHPEASLVELGSMLDIPIGKSGVNHRLKAIQNMAEELSN